MRITRIKANENLNTTFFCLSIDNNSYQLNVEEMLSLCHDNISVLECLIGIFGLIESLTEIYYSDSSHLGEEF